MDNPRGILYMHTFKKLPITAPRANIAIYISNLHKAIGKKVILNGVNLLVKEGTIHALVGLNGAGKTTTFKILLGFIRPDKGEISIFGKTPKDISLRDRIGYLPEIFNPPSDLTVREFLRYIIGIHGRKGNEKELLKAVGLQEHAKKKIGALSKGMLQRLGIAQAIAHDPKLLILDEPLSGLDPAGRVEIKKALLKLKKAGKTILFSTHILLDVIDLSESVSIIHEGRIVLSLPTSHVREKLSEAEFLRLVRSHEGNDNDVHYYN